MELQTVYRMNQRMKKVEEKIAMLKDAQRNIVPSIDGLPKARGVGASQVENLTVKIMTLEKELSTLREQVVSSAVELATAITDKVAAPASRILLARYVGCQKFKQIISETHYSDAHVYRLHADGVKQFKETI